MNIPKVPVYLYPYTNSPTHVIKVCRYVEEDFERVVDYNICCSIGRKDNYYKGVVLVQFLEEIMESLTPCYYISMHTASTILDKAEQVINSQTYGRGRNTITKKAQSLSERYKQEYKNYIDTKAALCIQKHYLENYYNPSKKFCQKRLLRDYSKLVSELKE